jgi:transposase
VLAQVIVSKWSDHLPLHRQEQIFLRHGVSMSRKTMGGWMAQCAALLNPLYGAAKKFLFESKVIGTDDTSVKVLDRKLPFARTGRIWPYCGDQEHPVILFGRFVNNRDSYISFIHLVANFQWVLPKG